jgi:UDP-N-acetylglucosamine--N-acetylmuramyl-(pentapeptide) pyrophosphoryl-undecaprenol N-acetylglucosamine transferase
LTGGGSGGHITPLLSLARELKQQAPDCQIVYIGHKGDNFDSLKLAAKDFDFTVFINGGKFRRYHGGSWLFNILDIRTWLLNIRDFFRVIKSIGTCLKIINKFQPDVVFSKGGFVAVPVGLAARLRRIPIVTHDSDAVPGLANRIVGRWARLHATGMPAEFYDYPKNTIEYVGIPIDSRIKRVTPKLQKQTKHGLKLPEDSEVLLLSGGGNGSEHLNELLIAISRHLLESNLSLQIIHIAGKAHEESVKRAYQHLLPKAQQNRVRTLGFSPDFYSLSAAADLIITRAGATTLAELAVAGKACIIIPAPFLAGGHQLKNAQQLADNDAAVVLDDSVEADELLAVINELLNDNSRRWQLVKNLYATAQPDAAVKLAGLILKVANTSA